MLGTMNQNKGRTKVSFRAQCRLFLPFDWFSVAIDWGVRSRLNNQIKVGIDNNAKTAVIIQISCHAKYTKSPTTKRGNVASPKEKPGLAIDKALPRLATNHRDIATVAICVGMPCPESRRQKITTGSRAAQGLNAISKHEPARTASTIGPMCFTRIISVRPPAISEQLLKRRYQSRKLHPNHREKG